MPARPIKVGGNRQYVDEVASGYPELPAKELDDDLNMLSNAVDSIIRNSVPIGGITTTMLADGSVTDPKILSVSWAKITGAPGSTPPSLVTSGVQSSGLTGTGTIILEQSPVLVATRPVMIVVDCNVFLLKLSAVGITCTVMVYLYVGGTGITDGTQIHARMVACQTLVVGNNVNIPVSFVHWYIPSIPGATRFKLVATGTGGTDYQNNIDANANLSVFQL